MLCPIHVCTDLTIERKKLWTEDAKLDGVLGLAWA